MVADVHCLCLAARDFRYVSAHGPSLGYVWATLECGLRAVNDCAGREKAAIKKRTDHHAKWGQGKARKAIPRTWILQPTRPGRLSCCLSPQETELCLSDVACVVFLCLVSNMILE